MLHYFYDILIVILWVPLIVKAGYLLAHKLYKGYNHNFLCVSIWVSGSPPLGSGSQSMLKTGFLSGSQLKKNKKNMNEVVLRQIVL